MIGAVIITHGSLASSLVEVAETISGKIENIRTVSVQSTDATDGIRESLASAVDEVSTGEGVIIFTDMFGGTPTNIALSLFKDGNVEVITGVNLPVLIKFTGHRSDKPLGELAVILKESAQQGIVLAGDMLRDK